MSLNRYSVIIKNIFLERGIVTIPNDLAEEILENNIETNKKTYDITIEFKNKKYKAILLSANRTDGSKYYRIEWTKNKELLNLLRKEYIQTYIKYKNKDYFNNQQNFYGTDEVINMIPLKNKMVRFKTFIKINTPYDNLFKKLVDDNIFYWIEKNDDNRQFIMKSTNWMSIDELQNHLEQKCVIYYLLDSNKKEIYIGSAKRLKDRVKPNRNEIPGWNYFRYEIVNPIFQNHLRKLEYHSIGNFAKFLDNNANINFFNISNYKLVNKECPNEYKN